MFGKDIDGPENRSRAVESPRVKKPRGRRGCLNATTSLVPLQDGRKIVIQSRRIFVFLIKFIYCEKATKFCEIYTNYIFVLCTASQIIGGDFAKFCGLLRIYELYVEVCRSDFFCQGEWCLIKAQPKIQNSIFF